MEIPQKINDRPMENYLDKHVRPGLCAACDVNPQAWKDLGKVLMPDAIAELSTISQDHRDRVINCCSRMFQLWLQRKPNASWKQLIMALKEINLNTLASQIEGMLMPSVDPVTTGASVVPMMPGGLDSSEDTCVERHVAKKIPNQLKSKYVALIKNLKKVFNEKQENYSAQDIIILLCTADEENLTFFATHEFFHSVKTMGDVFLFIGKNCKYYDYQLLKIFIDGTECAEAIALMNNYIKEVDSVVITGLNLQAEYDAEYFNDCTKKLEIFYDKDELKVKDLNVIREALQRCLHLPRASILMTDIVKNCIIIVCRIPLKAQYHLLQLRLTAHQLKPLSALHITALILDGSMKLSIPVDFDSKDVIPWTPCTPCIQTLTDANQGMISKRGDAEITIVLTGVSGSGKSAAANFFLKKKVHVDFGFGAKQQKFIAGMVGGKLTKFVDTPGLLDPDVKSDDEIKELANAILCVPNGIHGIGFVINIGNISSKVVKVLENLLAYVDMVPYVFVIFSNAYLLSSTYEKQLLKLKILLKSNDTLKILHKLLENIDNRYIILESVLNEEEGYYDTKVTELMKIIDSILDKQKEPFTCFLNDIARKLLESNKSQKECVDALKKDLRTAKSQLFPSAKTRFLKRFMVFVGVGAGAITGALVGAVAGPAGSAAGVTVGASAVAAIIGGGIVGGASGGIAGLSIGTKINECRTQ